ncbi:MAG: hypothetical protein ABF652_15160, partial [Clostridium beijerinckii]
DINEDFDDVLRKIKNDYPDFAIVNGTDYFQKDLIEIQKKIMKLYKLSFYISHTYNSNKYIIKSDKIELPKNPIKYREKKYFTDSKLLELLDYSIARVVIRPSDFVEYLQTVNLLKYDLLPRFFDFMRPLNAENLQDRYSSKEIQHICKAINEIKEKGEVIL